MGLHSPISTVPKLGLSNTCSLAAFRATSFQGSTFHHVLLLSWSANVAYLRRCPVGIVQLLCFQNPESGDRICYGLPFGLAIGASGQLLQAHELPAAVSETKN